MEHCFFFFKKKKSKHGKPQGATAVCVCDMVRAGATALVFLSASSVCPLLFVPRH